MALTKSAQATQASASNTAGSTTTGSAFATNYGVTGVAVVTNGATGPVLACDFVIDVSNDGGVTNWFEWSRQTSNLGNGTVTRFSFGLGFGSGADMGHYRTRFTGNTGQAVTVQCDAETTTAL